MDTENGSSAVLDTPSTETRSSVVGLSPLDYFSRIAETIGVGGVVSQDTALKQSVYYACVNLIADSVAQIPFKVYQEGPNGDLEVSNHYLNHLLCRKPNNWQTPFDYHHFVMSSFLMRGNAYVHTPKRGNGEVRSLIPILPDNVTVNILGYSDLLNPPDPIYTVSTATRPVSTYEMLHLRNMSKDGYLGLSPLSVAAEAIGIAEKAERRLSNIFKNRVGSEYKVELPNALTKEQFEQFRKQIEATYGQGMDIPIIAENGAKWNLMTINARDSQLIENRKFQVEDIARVFRVSLHMLQVEEAEKNSTGTSVEMKNRTFLDNTIVPHLTRLEQAYTNTLLDAEEIRSGLHIMADTSRFARADMKGRYESYRIGLGGGANPGFLSINDVRRKEREPLLDTKIGDVYYVPLNVKEAGTQPTEEDNG